MAKLAKDIIGSITPTQAPNLVRPEKEQIKAKLEEIIAKDTKIVKGTFVYEEYPGSHFHFKLPAKYKGVSFDKDMQDGQVYEIPKWVADWINGRDESKDAFNPNANKVTHSCQVPKNKFQVGKDELPKLNLDSDMVVDNIVASYKPKMRFIPLTFGD